MTVAVRAVYEDGVLKLEKPLDLEEHAKVRVMIEEETAAADDDPTGWKAARELIGCITEELIGDDVSLNHDHYLYGTPRR